MSYSWNNNLVAMNTRSHSILFLNPDTEMEIDVLAILTGYLDSHPDVGMVGPRLVFPDGTLQLSARRFPTMKTVIARRTPLRSILRGSRWNRYHLMEEADHSQTLEPDWLLGACIMVRRKAFEDVGGFDEGYRLYVEDIDLAYRMRTKGWKIVYVPQAVVIHHHIAESDHHLFSRASMWHFASMMRFWRKYKAPRWLRIKDISRGAPY